MDYSLCPQENPLNREFELNKNTCDAVEGLLLEFPEDGSLGFLSNWLQMSYF